MKKVLLGLLISTFSFSASLLAQETVPLTLQDALDATLKNNKEIVMAARWMRKVPLPDSNRRMQCSCRRLI